MGEEEKQPEGKKMEEKKPEEDQKAEDQGAEKKEEKKVESGDQEAKSEKPKEETKSEESKESAPPPPPPPPQEIVLRVYMHCEGCARKVRRCLKGFPGVEDVETDCKSHKVVVKGEKADPLKVLERVQRKSHRQVELLSPIPKPPDEDPKKTEEAAKEEAPKPEEKKEEVITVVLKFHMHCEACAQEIKKRIQRMKGVENAEPDLKSSQVTVKGVFDPQKLVEYVYKRTGKHGVIVKVEKEKKEEVEDGDKGKDVKEEKKGEEEGKAEEVKSGGDDGKDGKDGGEAAPATETGAAPAEEDMKMVELKKSEFPYYHYPHQYLVFPPQQQVYAPQYHGYPPHYPVYPPVRMATEMYPQYPPQMFSDENPNACSVM